MHLMHFSAKTPTIRTGNTLRQVCSGMHAFNRFPGFNYEVQGVFQERVEGRIKFHTYVVSE